MGIRFWIKLLIAVAAVLFPCYQNNGVSCQSPQEMRDFVLKANRKEYWPNLVCVPHAWSQDFIVELQKAKTSQELIEAGVSSLYKLEKITQHCDELVDKNKDQIDTKAKKIDCAKSCILRELGILENGWSQNTSLGDVTLATAQIKQLLTAKLYANRMNLSVEFCAEAVVKYIQFHMKGWQAYGFYREGFCFSSETIYRMPEYTRFLYKTTDEALNRCLRPNEPAIFPWKLYYPMHRIPGVKVDDLFNGWKSWPNTNCLNIRFFVHPTWDPTTYHFVKRTRKELLDITLDCLYQYKIGPINKEFGDNSYETCTKLCILEKMSILKYVTRGRYNNIFDKIGAGEGSIHERLHYLYKHNYWLVTSGFDGMIWFGANLIFDKVNSSLIEHGLATGAECYKTGLWEPFLRDADTIVAEACQVCESCRKQEKLWPPFPSFKVGNDKPEGDLEEQSLRGEYRQLKQINFQCNNSYQEPYEREKITSERWMKKCIMEEMGFITKTGVGGGIVELTPGSTFMTGLKSVLRGELSDTTIRNIGIGLYVPLRKSKLCGFNYEMTGSQLRNKPCEEKFYNSNPEWDNLFAIVDNFFVQFRKTETCDYCIKDEKPEPSTNMESPKLWPDFSSVKGWYDASNDTVYEIIAESQSGGFFALKSLNSMCNNEYPTHVPSSNQKRCVKKCILQTFTVIEKTRDGSVRLTEISTFKFMLRVLLTDKGRQITVRNIANRLNATLTEESIAWDLISYKDCGDAEWDILFHFLDNLIKEERTVSTHPEVKSPRKHIG